MLEAFHKEVERGLFPDAVIAGCTTAGEIAGVELSIDSLVLTFLRFESTRIRQRTVTFAEEESSRETTAQLCRDLQEPDLRHIFVLSEGVNINGTHLINGIRENQLSNVAVTGGLAADGELFKHTAIVTREGVKERSITGIGFYGNSLSIGFGSLGGWDPFGTERTITRATESVLYELDGKPALPLYKEYLGELAKDLPASGLLYPLAIQVSGSHEPLVRTLLAVDETKQSLTFAGDVPVGCKARLMKANFDRLLDGAASAANICSLGLGTSMAQFAILVSCVGRRLVLKQRTEEELEAVREYLGPQTVLTGFYSYGEIAPFIRNARCEFHNQTMTITAFAER